MALRPEAQPLAEKTWTDSQSQAYREIVRWLEDAVDGLARQPTDGAKQAYRMHVGHQVSRVGMLSGGRGTGKTSLLLSLVASTSPGFGVEGPDPADGDLAKRVRKLRGRLVWLTPLDMESLPGPTNLLAAILSRVDLAFPSRAGRERAGILDVNSVDEEAQVRLDRLRNDIALAWRGQLPRELQPEEYVLEVGRTETARLEVNQRLGEVLDDLAASKLWPGEIEDPLFVLPVDDVDLNPYRCLDLLQLLRMICTPRLFALVLGDSWIAEVVSNVTLAGHWSHLAKGAGRERLISIPAAEVAGIVGSTAANVIRKLLPPAQRVKLEGMNLDGALRYVPDGRMETLRQLLGKFQAIPNPTGDPELDYGTLADFLLLPQKEGEKCPYWAAQMLAGPPRQVVDLWHVLYRQAPDPVHGVEAGRRSQTLLEIFIGFLQSLVQEELGLSPGQRQAVLLGVQRDTEGRPYFDTDVLVLDRELNPGRALPARSCSLVVRQAARWQFRPWDEDAEPKPKVDGRPRRKALDERTGSAIMLVHDLLVLGTQGNVLGEPLAKTVNPTGWIGAEWHIGTSRVFVPWPELDWRTFREFDAFAETWSRVSHVVWDSRRTSPDEETAQVFANAFLRCLVDAAEKTPTVAASTANVPTPTTWKALWSRLAKLLDGTTWNQRRGVLRTIPVTIACALAPESGFFIPSVEIAKLAGVMERYWAEPACAQAIRSARADSARPFFEGRAGALAYLLMSPRAFFKRIEETLTKAAELTDPPTNVDPLRARIMRNAERTTPWGTDIRRFLDTTQRAFTARRTSRGRRSAASMEHERDLTAAMAFLQDAADAIDKVEQGPASHPINTACKGTLCPRAQDLARLETSAPSTH